MGELVEDGVNGLLFDPGSPADLAKSLRRLQDEPDLLKHLQDGIAPVKSIDSEIDELEEIYCRLAASREAAL
jgi:glycosyltransferase involved in cell wall biosynthesis